MVRFRAARRQMSRLQPALYFFCFPLAARRVPSVRAALRRVGNAEPVQVGFGFERSLVARGRSFWSGCGYYTTPSRPQRYKLTRLVAAGKTMNPPWQPEFVEDQWVVDGHREGSPARPGSDGWRPLFQLCSLLVCLHHASQSCCSQRYAQTQQTRGSHVSSAVPGTNFGRYSREREKPAARTHIWETTSGVHHQHQQDAARANTPCQAT